MFERALCAIEAPDEADERDLVVVEVDAVGEQRPLVERACAREPLGHAQPVPGLGVALVGAVLGGVDVEADPEVGGGRGARLERLVREREGGVRADHPARERRPLAAHALEEAPVLVDARPSPGSSPSRSLVS